MLAGSSGIGCELQLVPVGMPSSIENCTHSTESYCWNQDNMHVFIWRREKYLMYEDED